MGEKFALSAILWQKGKVQIAWCPEPDIDSQSTKVEEALANLHEAMALSEDEDAKFQQIDHPFYNIKR